jgi:predicted 2-oxoglutarate/Fe(II)-dependent dioxygenase YbiX
LEGNWSTKDHLAPAEAVLDLSGVVQKLNLKAHSRYAVFLRNVFTAKECQDLIERSEQEGYQQALLNVGGGQQIMAADVRNSDRCIINDTAFADLVFTRILDSLQKYSHLMDPLMDWNRQGRHCAVGCNELLRFLRYDPGHYFLPHTDGSFQRGADAGPERMGEASKITAMIYLNEGFQGGETRFVDERNSNNGFNVVPETGSVLLFQHDIFHEGCLLERGRKYAIRTDIMYSTKSRSAVETEEQSMVVEDDEEPHDDYYQGVAKALF